MVLALPNITSLLSSTTSSLYSSLWTEKSVFLRVPPEILREILVFAIFAPIYHDRDLETPVIASDLGSPFPFSQVCRTWRDIVINSPSFWTHICIYSPSFRHMYRTEIWLSRLANRAVNITLRQSALPTLEETEATNALVHLFGKHCEKWKSVHFSFALPPASLAITLENAKRVSQLHEAYISIRPPTTITDLSVPYITEAYSHLNATMGLRKFTWKAALLPHAPFHSQLQFLELGTFIHAKVLLQGIKACPRLIYLSARDVCGDEDPPSEAQTHRIVLEELVILILTLRKQNRSPLADVLGHLKTPALTQLQLQHMLPAPPPVPDRPQSDRAVVCTFLAVSGCRLNSLNVDILDATPGELRAWLTLPGITDLETLCMAGGTVDDSVLQDLTWTHLLEPPNPDTTHRGGKEHSAVTSRLRNRLPRLRQLGLAVCSANVDEGVLLRMVGSRFWTPLVPGVTADDPERMLAELRVAHIWVRERTSGLVAYERMMDLCAKRIAAWATPGERRDLQFTVV